MNFDATTPVGLGLIVVGIFIAVKAAKFAVKVVMLAVIALGVYVAFSGRSFAELNPFG